MFCLFVPLFVPLCKFTGPNIGECLDFAYAMQSAYWFYDRIWKDFEDNYVPFPFLHSISAIPNFFISLNWQGRQIKHISAWTKIDRWTFWILDNGWEQLVVAALRLIDFLRPLGTFRMHWLNNERGINKPLVNHNHLLHGSFHLFGLLGQSWCLCIKRSFTGHSMYLLLQVTAQSRTQSPLYC